MEEGVRQIRRQKGTYRITMGKYSFDYRYSLLLFYSDQVKDNTTLLHKSIHKRVVEKKKSKKEWKEREQKKEKDIENRQKKREANLAKKAETKKKHKLKKATKRGRIIAGL